MIGLKTVDLQKQKIDTLIVPVCEDKEIHEDRIIKRVIKKALQLKEFKAEKDNELTLYDLKDLNTKRIIFVGLGKLNKIDHETLRAFCGAIVKKCITADFEAIWVTVPAAQKLKMEMPEVVKALMEGACLGNHLFDKYKKEKKKRATWDRKAWAKMVPCCSDRDVTNERAPPKVHPSSVLGAYRPTTPLPHVCRLTRHSALCRPG